MSSSAHSLLCLGLALLVASGARAAPFQDAFRATYALSSYGQVVGNTRWSSTGGAGERLVYESESEAVGFAKLFHDAHIVERSEWRRRDGTLRPYEYRYERTRGEKSKLVQVSFDWERGYARNTAKGESWSMPLPEQALDKLGYMLAMMHDLEAGKRNLAYLVADGGKLKTYHLAAVGEERIHTDLGELGTLKVERRRGASERETTFWCAPKYRFLPVKVVHKEDDGMVLTLTIKSVEGLAPPEL